MRTLLEKSQVQKMINHTKNRNIQKSKEKKRGELESKDEKKQK